MLRRGPALLVVLLSCLFLRPALAQEAPPLEADTGPRAASQRPPVPPVAKPLAKAPARPVAKPAAKSAAKPVMAAKPARGPAVKNDGKRYLRSLDENHDGRISREEFLASARKRFAKLDVNNDGVISAQEARAAKAQNDARAEARRKAKGAPAKVKADNGRPPRPYLSTYDADKNGRVTRKEFLARREKQFADMDLNHDGVISKDEARAAKAKKLARRAELKAEKQERQARREARRVAAEAEPQ